MMQLTPTSNQVFITHVRNDKDLIQLSRLLAERLEQNGFPVWTEERIAPDADEAGAIQAALRESDSMIALLSRVSYSSSHVRFELEHAFFDERYKNRLLPVLIGDSEEESFRRLPWVLTRMEYLKITEPLAAEEMVGLILRAFQDMLQSGSRA